jgi:hypothetical protein
VTERQATFLGRNNFETHCQPYFDRICRQRAEEIIAKALAVWKLAVKTDWFDAFPYLDTHPTPPVLLLVCFDMSYLRGEWGEAR